MAVLELSPCSAQKPLTETRGRRASAAAAKFQFGALLLGGNLLAVRGGLCRRDPGSDRR